MPDGTPYPPRALSQPVSLPVRAAAQSAATSLDHAKQLVETLTRAQTALAAGNHAKAARLAEDAARMCRETGDFIRVLKAQTGQLERNA